EDITSATSGRGVAPSAVRSPSSRVRCDTLYEITPYSPITARSSATPENMSSSVTVICWADVDRLTCSRIVRISYGETLASIEWMTRTIADGMPRTLPDRDERTYRLIAVGRCCASGM